MCIDIMNGRSSSSEFEMFSNFVFSSLKVLFPRLTIAIVRRLWTILPYDFVYREDRSQSFNDYNRRLRKQQLHWRFHLNSIITSTRVSQYSSLSRSKSIVIIRKFDASLFVKNTTFDPLFVTYWNRYKLIRFILKESNYHKVSLNQHETYIVFMVHLINNGF